MLERYCVKKVGFGSEYRKIVPRPEPTGPIISTGMGAGTNCNFFILLFNPARYIMGLRANILSFSSSLITL